MPVIVQAQFVIPLKIRKVSYVGAEACTAKYRSTVPAGSPGGGRCMQEGRQGSTAGICGKRRRWGGRDTAGLEAGLADPGLTPQRGLEPGGSTGLSRVGEARPRCLHMQQSRGPQEGATI